MSKSFIITGTDTDVGKTVFAAALCGALGGHYWKPVQAGLASGTDSASVAALSGLPARQILPEIYRLTTPCSPHRAAAIDGVEIDPTRLELPSVDGPLIVEGAGGALVPISGHLLYADQFAVWRLPVIIVARTALGTINHSLLTIEALRARDIPIHGIAFIGVPFEDSEAIISHLGGVRCLGRLPFLPVLDAATLKAAFADNFSIGDFQ